MNNLLNLLLRKLVRALMAKRGVPLAVLVVAGAMAGWDALRALDGDVQARPQGAVASQGGYTMAGRVLRVSDGDTFNILVDGREQRIRMASIDAPETGKRDGRRGQPYAKASRDVLAALIAGKTLTLICHEQDRYSRHICDVPLDGNTTANQQQVRKGMAWANMEKRGKFLRDSSLPGLEEQARKERLGLWQQSAVAPWVWRYQCWQKQQC